MVWKGHDPDSGVKWPPTWEPHSKLKGMALEEADLLIEDFEAQEGAAGAGRAAACGVRRSARVADMLARVDEAAEVEESEEDEDGSSGEVAEVRGRGTGGGGGARGEGASVGVQGKEEVFKVRRLVTTRRSGRGGRGWRQWEVQVEWEGEGGVVVETWEPIFGTGLLELNQAARELARAEHGLRGDGGKRQGKSAADTRVHECVIHMALEEGVRAVMTADCSRKWVSAADVCRLWGERGGVLGRVGVSDVASAMAEGAAGDGFARMCEGVLRPKDGCGGDTGEEEGLVIEGMDEGWEDGAGARAGEGAGREARGEHGKKDAEEDVGGLVGEELEEEEEEQQDVELLEVDVSEAAAERPVVDAALMELIDERQGGDRDIEWDEIAQRLSESVGGRARFGYEWRGERIGVEARVMDAALKFVNGQLVVHPDGSFHEAIVDWWGVRWK